MRISNISLLLSLAAGIGMAWPGVTPAFAVQDQPATIGGVETVCTGVGSAKDNPAWSAYPVKLVFATPSGADLAAVHVALMQGGKTMMETDCDAPWVLLKMPAGNYSIRATIAGNAGMRVGNASFSGGGNGAQKTVTVTIPPAK